MNGRAVNGALLGYLAMRLTILQSIEPANEAMSLIVQARIDELERLAEALSGVSLAEIRKMEKEFERGNRGTARTQDRS